MNLKNKTEEEIRVIFQPGRTFYHIGDKYRVVNYTFDGDAELIIVKSWNRYKNRWCYETWTWHIFYPVYVRFGNISLTKRKR